MSNRPTGKSAAHDAPPAPAADASARHPALDRIDDALRGLRYGSVLAIVQDGVVVQIERTEKTRLPFPEKR